MSQRTNVGALATVAHLGEHLVSSLHLALVSLVLLVLAGRALALGATNSAPIDTAPTDLKPGEFIWTPEAVPAGPLVMVISLDEQLAYLYRNGVRIGVSTVSTGKKGKETPTGVFTILQKHKEHISTLYDDAPMPFMQRLTWDGVALHAGNLPGYPASHGCIRLPYEFARRLFDVTNFGMTVVVAAAAAQHAELAHPGFFSPATVETPSASAPGVEVPRLSWSQAFAWNPEKSPEGPLTILVGAADRMVFVIRNGVQIGRSRIKVSGDAPFGTQAYVMLQGDSGEPSAVVPGRRGRNWQAIPLPGYAARPGTTLDKEAAKRVTVPPEFATLIYDQLQPGTTLLLTDAPVLSKTTGEAMTVISADEDEPFVPVPPANDTPDH